MAPFVVRRQVTFSETDMAGIVHFANFYRWMEEAEHDYFRSIGLRIMRSRTMAPTSGGHESPLRATSSRQPATRIGSRSELRSNESGFKSLNFEVEFWRDQTRLAHGRLKTACCICRPDSTLEAIEIPALYRQRIES